MCFQIRWAETQRGVLLLLFVIIFFLFLLVSSEKSILYFLPLGKRWKTASKVPYLFLNNTVLYRKVIKTETAN